MRRSFCDFENSAGNCLSDRITFGVIGGSVLGLCGDGGSIAVRYVMLISNVIVIENFKMAPLSLGCVYSEYSVK